MVPSVVAGSAQMGAVGLITVLGKHAGLWRQEEIGLQERQAARITLVVIR